MYAFDTNVDACKPGDKVTCTGEGHEGRCQVRHELLAARKQAAVWIAQWGFGGPETNPGKVCSDDRTQRRAIWGT
jgi:hypothetical protein